MAYEFVNLRLTPNMDTCWYLTVRDYETLFEIHANIACSRYRAWTANPHKHQLADREFTNPITLAAAWLKTATNCLEKHGVFYVNSVGGIYAGPGVEEVLETSIREKLQYPSNRETRITLTTWPGGRHYYLESDTGLIFSREKYDTYAEAMAEALLHTSEEKITYKPSYLNSVCGD